MIQLRTITSLTLAITLLFSLVTSLILYIVPKGRVAYWSDWRLLGLDKTQWSELHLNLGLLLLVAGIFHIYFNWKPLVNYLKSRSKQLKVFTVNFNVALLLTLCVLLGTYFQIPPLSSIIELSESIKDAAAVKYGEPPYGHAELSSLKKFTKKQDLDLQESVRKLKAAGLIVDHPGQTILDIARQNRVTPKQVHELIKTVSPKQEKR